MTLAVSDVVRYLLFPVAVLLVGIVVSGLIIPELTRRRDSHRKALEIKTELVSDMSEAVMDFVMAVQFAVLGAVGQTQEQYDAAYRTWEKSRAVIGTKLEAYFPGTEIGRDWDAFAHRVTDFYALTGIHDHADRRERAAELLAMYGRRWPDEDEPDDRWIGAWGNLKDAILEEKSEMIQRVLLEPAHSLEEPSLLSSIPGLRKQPPQVTPARRHEHSAR